MFMVAMTDVHDLKGQYMEARDPDTHAIIGAAMDVHNILGHGFLEGVYLEALGIELARNGVPHRVECPLPITYRNIVLIRSYRADLICNEAILVELKALTRLSGTED